MPVLLMLMLMLILMLVFIIGSKLWHHCFKGQRRLVPNALHCGFLQTEHDAQCSDLALAVILLALQHLRGNLVVLVQMGHAVTNHLCDRDGLRYCVAQR
jgi:hypothetical protein